MTASTTALPLLKRRPWIPPTLKEHDDLVMMARTMATAFASVVALQGIGFSCTVGTPGCTG